MPTWIDPGEIEFDAAIVPGSQGRGAFVEVPLDTADLYGTRGRIPVVASLDGLRFHASLFSYGGPHWLGVLRAVRAELGKGVGDHVHVRLRLDDVPSVPHAAGITV
ncbi:DUF1905 domain-containing protein [Oerskovia flava]|uniref:DUF1905 domain-containing protein n=1 Tax=Oerskovia flava TaxID=2986422 RepID=UPI002240668B|nr:DUF1905 domain-containing protein [Oerskovia sp. JB1-3-2]